MLTEHQPEEHAYNCMNTQDYKTVQVSAIVYHSVTSISGVEKTEGSVGLVYRSSGVRPVLFAMRASIRGPISSRS